MLEKGSGTILYTGATASLRGGAKFSGLVLFPPFVCILMYQRLVLRTFTVSSLGRGQVRPACSGAVNRKRVWLSGNSRGAHHHRWPGGPGAEHQGTTTLALKAVPVTTGLSPWKPVQAQEGRALDSFLSSDAIAEEYWHLYTQHKTTCTNSAAHASGAREHSQRHFVCPHAGTLEVDLRPYVEKF